jgi:uracil-DNA glycosylase family 4
MLIGERPGEHEAIAGRPFVGRAGEMLDTLLAAANLDRKQIYITNLVKTFAEYGKPTSADIEEWAPTLYKEIQDVQPEIIGCLGTYAVEWMLQRDRAEMEKTHGVPVRYSWIGRDIIVLPIFHPAAALYTPETMNNVLDDFLRLAQLADGELDVREDLYAGKEDYQRTDRLSIDAPVIAVDTKVAGSTRGV